MDVGLDLVGLDALQSNVQIFWLYILPINDKQLVQIFISFVKMTWKSVFGFFRAKLDKDVKNWLSIWQMYRYRYMFIVNEASPDCMCKY